MTVSFRNILLAVALGLSAQSWALDLPVKRVQGKDYYYYTVERGESLSQIASKIGVSREDIVRVNPAAADGVRGGAVLYFPVADFAEDDTARAGVSSADSGATLRYKVQKGETLFGIAYRFGVTPDEIAALNPKANSGVKSGMILLIPSAESASTDNEAVKQPESQRLRPVNPGIVAVPAPVAYDEEDDCDDSLTNVPDQAVKIPEESRLRPVNPVIVAEEQFSDTASIMVMLPLMLDDETPSKMARSASDFARGFLLGVKSMSNTTSPVKIQIVDTRGSQQAISDAFAQSASAPVDIVVAPEDAASLATVIEASSPMGSTVFNLFAVSDTTYLTNSRVVQANITAPMMYEKAGEALLANYADHIPVFLISKGGKGEKKPFTDYLRQQYASLGVEPIDLVFDGMLSQAELDDLDISSKYIFIPASGSLTEFNKFARTLNTFRSKVISPSDVAVWGYPDWTLFRGDSLDMLHSLGATIYSRFYCDPESAVVNDFSADFEGEYGMQPADQVPSQAIMGYDAARFLLQNITDNGGTFTPANQPLFTGIQNSFLFLVDEDDPEEHAGPVNQTLYIVKFQAGDSVEVNIL